MKFKFNYKEILDFFARNFTWLAIVGVGLFFLNPTYVLINKLFVILVLEGMAMGLSGVALYVFTKVKFTKWVAMGNDDLLTEEEHYALMKYAGYVFLGVHVLVGLSFFILSLEAV